MLFNVNMGIKKGWIGKFMPTMNMTKVSISALPITSHRTKYSDKGGAKSVPGLKLYVYPSGEKVFYFRKSVKGNVIEKKLGDYTILSVEKAREMALEFSRISLYKMHTSYDNMTFDELYDKYINLFKNEVMTGSKREGSLEAAKRYYRIHIQQELGKKKVGDYTFEDAVFFLSDLGAKKGYAIHNLCLTTLKSMFNKTSMPFNPFQRVKKIKEAPYRKTRFLSQDEIARLLDAASAESQIYKDVISALLLTGQRKSAVFGMQWKELNMDDCLWYIPADRQKGNCEHAVPLCDELMEILRRRFADKVEGTKFVFPSPRSKEKPLSNKSGDGSFWNRIVKRAGFYDPDNSKVHVTIRDLRRTAATYQYLASKDIRAAAQLLGHTNLNTTAWVYTILNTDNLKPMLQKSVDFMLSSTKDTKSSS
jgi:integrase